LSFNDDFGDVFEDLDVFNDKFMKRFQRELSEVLKQIKAGKIKGTFEAKEIKEPGVRGYVILGRFGTDEALEPIEPLKPWRRPPLPERPFEVPETAFKETREPLTDIFEEDNALKIYVELPGEKKDDITLKATEDNVEIKAKNFYKMLKLPKKQTATEAVSSEYKNGVLKITIPKKAELREKDAKKARSV